MAEDSYKTALNVQDGVNQPSQVNPYLDFSKVEKPAKLSAEDYVQGILKGDRVKLSQSITLIESYNHKDFELSQQIIESCMPYSGKSIRIGITGVPGAGKSTFIEAFGKYLTAHGHRLAVLTIDPSSERSKGSILGDKTRMEELSVDSNAFIRPSPSAGTLGGVARKTRESSILCEAAGFDVIIVETVGVGQSETAVKNMVDFFLLLMISGAGDELQGIKRGIMEMADTIVINKADGDNLHRAELTKSQIMNALMLFPPPPSLWKTKTLTASSLEKTGIEEVWQTITDYLAMTHKSGYFEQNRTAQSCKRFFSFMEEELCDAFYNNIAVQEKINDVKKSLLENKIGAYTAGHQVLKTYFENK